MPDQEYICDMCEEPCEDTYTVHQDDGWNSNDLMVCSECLDDTMSCEGCGDTYTNESIMQVDSTGEYLCRTCLDDNYFCCSSCNELYHNEDVWWNSYGDPECADCRRGSDHEAIQRWDYRPQFIRYADDRDPPNAPTYGVEVEIVTGQGANVCNHMSSVHPGFWYFKEDGSVSGGFECVSHPFTWAWAQANPEVFGLLFGLSKFDVQSYNSASCGMHVHIGRKSFVSDLHLYKFTALMYNDPDFILKVSRRQKSRLDQWANPAPNVNRSLARMIKNKDSDGRYRALNFENRNTVECRIFRGTISPSGFWANMEFLKAMLDYTRKCSVQDVTVPKFESWVKDRKKEYGRFVNTLLFRDLEV